MRIHQDARVVFVVLPFSSFLMPSVRKVLLYCDRPAPQLRKQLVIQLRKKLVMSPDNHAYLSNQLKSMIGPHVSLVCTDPLPVLKEADARAYLSTGESVPIFGASGRNPLCFPPF